MQVLILFCLLGGCLALAQQETANSTQAAQKAKLFTFLQVVKFPNSVCQGNTRNGTCYTTDECIFKKGVSQGSCANGFGVCCVFVLDCGRSSSENCTYLTLGATATTPSPSTCVYTICENNPNICRIRLDFTTFAIAGPIVGTTINGAVADLSGGGIGDCITDTFTLSAPSNKGSPIICGLNTGQHMYLDSSNECARATFNFGAAAFNRQYDIKVTQFSCNEEQGGPPDCLQYFTGNTGTIQNYNFNLVGGAVNPQTTHLSNQCYNICFRRNLNKCGICFGASIAISISAAMQASFGLSATKVVIAQAENDVMCNTDYIAIRSGISVASPIAPITAWTTGISRICGRFFNVQNLAVNAMSICTFTRPFQLLFKTDANEMTIGVAGLMAQMNEESGIPGGIVGFQLFFTQIGC